MKGKELIEEFKEHMHQTMLKYFKNDGALQPILFFVKGNQPAITPVPIEMFESVETKIQLANMMKMLAQQPEVISVGLVMEAFCTVFEKGDTSEEAQAVVSGEKKVSECENKFDIIALLHFTPEKDETIIYKVNPEEKTILEEIGDREHMFRGIFSNMFVTLKN